MQGVGAAEKVFEYIDRKPEHPSGGSEAPATLNGEVEFLNVSFSYPTRPDTKILKVDIPKIFNMVGRITNATKWNQDGSPKWVWNSKHILHNYLMFILNIFLGHPYTNKDRNTIYHPSFHHSSCHLNCTLNQKKHIMNVLLSNKKWIV